MDHAFWNSYSRIKNKYISKYLYIFRTTIQEYEKSYFEIIILKVYRYYEIAILEYKKVIME